MLLYHGTSLAHWEGIKRDRQLKGRGALKNKGQWEHTVPSHPQCVYLTECYAGYFAMNAGAGRDQHHIALLEFNTEFIEGRLVPDEDAVERMMRGEAQEGRAALYSRTRKARAVLYKYVGTPTWRDSLALLGTCAHFGPLGLEHCTRVAIIEVAQQKWLCREWLQPSITPANRRFCYDRYLDLTARSFQSGPGIEVLDMRQMLTEA